MAEFCKQFNEKTESLYEKGTPVSVQLTALSDRTFTFDVRSPPTSYLLKAASGVEKGPAKTNHEKPVGFVTPEQVYEIARLKQKDGMRWHLPLEGIAKSVVGTAKSMGIHVREADDDDVVVSQVDEK
eukprot:CAMPEP_0185731796 /NCGR_PEP_ID=MMETSP1171-20130828/13927_1 /TAXON_ID=374046 /ORGANISM="Helicotheca tamensis, Strain CCMP826" /LENGTH=126 /DNA_ID=CAMNT_0028401125 /DNA_START=231 /DNA_END=611 /DNA_ORIENTATION=+